MAVEKNKLNEDASLVRFCKIVLGWDYFRLVEESSKRSKDRKNKVKDEYVAGLGLKEVKDTYKDVDDYFATFEPLLFEEVKAQIVQGRDDEEDVTGWRSGAIQECAETNEFHSPMVVYECDEDDTVSHNGTISQNDLLLLKASNNLRTYAFAFVEHCRPPNGVKLKLYLAGEVKGTMVDEVKSCSRLLNMRNLVSQVGKSLEMLKICSLSTIFREYVALRSISSLPFKDLILKADESSSESENRAWKIPGPLMESIKDNYNESQRGAINAGLSRRAFVLIQGPPGTGKTQTILGLLSAILHATPAIVHSKNGSHEIKRGPELPTEDKYKHWGLASPWLTGINPRDQIMPVDGDDGFFPTTGNDFKPEVVNSSRKYRVRVLVCAPSNSALDEIVLRLLKTGLRDENDRVYNPKIVRIGLKPHHSVQSVAMDYLAEQRLAGVDLSSNKQKHGTGKDINSIIRASILDESVIVFSTLSFSGSRLFSKLPYSFDVVIIDEAAQAVEPATLIPLATGCKQVFLVGDPVQLPATVISPIAEKFGYKTSLFKRFQNAGYPVQMLKTQYRMHPEIRSFPSSEFYEDELEDAPNVKKQTRRPWHAYRCFGPFCFFDIHEGKEFRPSGSGSWVNVDEVEFVLLLYHKLVTAHPKLKSSSQLAIIAPYVEQVQLIRKRFLETFGVESKEVVDINTVDGFQGREKDVAIFSCVRASEDKGIGFVDDFRRMNVAITRARSSVLVVGSASTLKRGGGPWKNLIESAEKRDSLCKVSKPYSSFFSVENLKSMEAAIDDGMDLDMEDLDEMEHNVASYGNPTADAAPEDENDYGDGRDADAGDFEED